MDMELAIRRFNLDKALQAAAEASNAGKGGLRVKWRRGSSARLRTRMASPAGWVTGGRPPAGRQLDEKGGASGGGKGWW